MLSIALCNDNLEYALSLQKILTNEFLKQKVNARINFVTSDLEKIEKLVKNREIDFLILDTEFKDENFNSVEFAKRLRKTNKEFYLVFLSNNYGYLCSALSTKIFDYLLRPLKATTIHDLVTRIKDEISQNNMFINITKWQTIKASEIIYMEKSVNRTVITTTKGDITCTKTLDKMQDTLPSNFARCHRSFIMNKDKIISLDRKSKEVYLDKNIVCPINDKFYI
ncbi:MAG: LytTR family transcriptional regulator DNA-binding domain-containing protein [Clostridia bacterium]|nr:LytTR family transcriptional regulator DNA-binding domain-containing protein [Clostridia bacterium]